MTYSGAFRDICFVRKYLGTFDLNWVILVDFISTGPFGEYGGIFENMECTGNIFLVSGLYERILEHLMFQLGYFEESDF